MSWTAQQAEQAAREGWGLADTIDNGTSHVYLMLVRRGGAFKSDWDAGLHVVARARTNSPLHKAALSAVVISRVPQQKPRQR